MHLSALKPIWIEQEEYRIVSPSRAMAEYGMIVVD